MMSKRLRRPIFTCPRCLREAEDSATPGQRRSMRGYPHRKLHVSFDDERALALFFSSYSIYTPALDGIRYVPQGEDRDPRPVLVDPLTMGLYAGWAHQHGVGNASESVQLQRIATNVGRVHAYYQQQPLLLPDDFQQEKLAIVLLCEEQPQTRLHAAVLRLVVVDWDLPEEM